MRWLRPIATAFAFSPLACVGTAGELASASGHTSPRFYYHCVDTNDPWCKGATPTTGYWSSVPRTVLVGTKFDMGFDRGREILLRDLVSASTRVIDRDGAYYVAKGHGVGAMLAFEGNAVVDFIQLRVVVPDSLHVKGADELTRMLVGSTVELEVQPHFVDAIAEAGAPRYSVVVNPSGFAIAGVDGDHVSVLASAVGKGTLTISGAGLSAKLPISVTDATDAGLDASPDSPDAGDTIASDGSADGG